MHQRGLSTVLFLATIVLILITGCGGGDQSGSGSQQAGGSQAEQGENAPVEQGENAPKKQGKNAPEKKVVFGTVTFVNPKTEGFSVVADHRGTGQEAGGFQARERVQHHARGQGGEAGGYEEGPAGASRVRGEERT